MRWYILSWQGHAHILVIVNELAISLMIPLHNP
jgi:hypothetical protein